MDFFIFTTVKDGIISNFKHQFYYLLIKLIDNLFKASLFKLNLTYLDKFIEIILTNLSKLT